MTWLYSTLRHQIIFSSHPHVVKKAVHLSGSTALYFEKEDYYSSSSSSSSFILWNTF